MANGGGRRPAAMAVVCALIVAATSTGSSKAEAFELKHTTHGQPLRWDASNVSYVIDPSIEAVAGGEQAAAKAVAGWQGIGGVPSLSTTQGKGGAKAGLDGQNSVLFAPNGFAPAGNALAITVTSFDQSTGDIVDTDVVVNGIHPFAVLDPDARPEGNEAPVSNEAGSPPSDADSTAANAYDLLHVLSHEFGHTLGLADDQDEQSALMYAYSSRGDASIRQPTPDDVNGVEALYGTEPAPAPAPSSQAGCGQASVASARPLSGDMLAVAMVAGAGLWLLSRRRALRCPRVELPVATALVALVTGYAPSGATPHVVASELRSDAIARVVSVSTSNVGGLFETTIQVEPTACRLQTCPAQAAAHAWGGTLGGITQQVGGEPVPAVGDLVNVAFVASGGAAGANVRTAVATLIPAHR
jgi:matrixin